MYNFLKNQFNSPTRNDWRETVKKDIEECEINPTVEEIERMSTSALKTLANKKQKGKHSQIYIQPKRKTQ